GSASRPDRAPRAGAGGARQDPGSQARRRSSMTDRAVGEGLRMYMVLCFERLAGRRIRPALPMRIEDSVTRTQMRRRIAMAIETPTHIKGGRLARQRHVTDRAVTFGAADAFGDMDAVIEIDVVRQGVDALPAQRLMLREALPHRCQDESIRPDLRVAGHAGLGRRHAGIPCHLDRGVTVATIEAEAAHMMLVTERHRLRRRKADLVVVAHARYAPHQQRQEYGAARGAEEAGIHQQIGALPEDRRHLGSLSTAKPPLNASRLGLFRLINSAVPLCAN